MNSSEPPDISPGAAIVIAILEAISNRFSALPPATSVAQTSSVQRTGGFASAFAAAKGLSTAVETASGEGSMGPMAQNTGAAIILSLKMRTQAAANPQGKRLLNSDAVGASTAVANVVPEFIPAMAIQIPLPAPRSLSGPSLPPALTAAVQAEAAEGLAGTVPSGLNPSGSYLSGSNRFGSETPAYDVMSQSTRLDHSLLDPAAAIFTPLTGPVTSSVTSPDSTVRSLTDRSAADLPASGVLIPNRIGGPAGWQETSTANSLLPSVFSPNERGAASGSVFDTAADQGDGWGGPVSADPTTLAESTLLPAFTATTRQAPSGSALPEGAGNLWNGIQADGFGLESAKTITPANVRTEPAASAPTLLASANSANAVVPDMVPDIVPHIMPNAAVQSGVPAQTGTGNPLWAIPNGQVAPSTLLNTAEPAASTRAALQFAVPRVTPAVTSLGTRGAGAGARTSVLAGALSTAPVSDNGSAIRSPIGNQTPFSVFFSDPGPGMESAASALPKLILPPNGAAMREGHMSGANASASPQGSGLPSGVSQNGVSQNAAPPNIKDSLNAGGGSQTAPGSRRDADANAASAQLAAAQNGAMQNGAAQNGIAQNGAAQNGTAPVPGPPSSAAVTLPLNPVVASATDALPKPEPVPATPAGTIPGAIEMPPAAVPGPVQVAQMINRIGQTEMRIGMNTSAFGSVEVRTVVHANDVGLVIGSEKGDLRTLLTNDMPAIRNTLQQQNLRLNSVNFTQGFAFSNNASGGGDSQQHSFVPMRGSSTAGLSEAMVDDSLELPPAGEFAGGGLSILA